MTEEISQKIEEVKTEEKTEEENIYKPEFTQIKHRDELIPDGYRAIIIFGSSRSGKTSILPKLISMLLDYQLLHVFTCNPTQPVYEFLKDECEKKGVVFRITTTPTWITKNPEIERKRSEYLKSNKHNIIVVDDFNSKKELANFNSLFSAGRHLNATVITICQNYFNIPDEMRTNATDYLMFPVAQKSSLILQRLPVDDIIPYERMKELYKQICSSASRETMTEEQTYGECANFLWANSEGYLNPVFRIRRGFHAFLPDLINPF